MKGRPLIAGVLAGLLAFFWGFVSHELIGLGESSMKGIPNEPAVLTALSDNIKESGFYFFPGAGMMDPNNGTKEQKEAAMKKWDEDFKKYPSGILVVKQPTGDSLPFTKLLLRQLLADILGGLIAALLLSLAVPSLPSFTGRVLFVATLGLFASLAIDVPYWNWYGFPTRYLLSALVDSVVGWGLAGVLLAALIRPRL